MLVPILWSLVIVLAGVGCGIGIGLTVGYQLGCRAAVSATIRQVMEGVTQIQRYRDPDPDTSQAAANWLAARGVDMERMRAAPQEGGE